jgi:serine/threonine protein kinase
MSYSKPLISEQSYRILGQVGQGQFAQVFCGIHRETGTVVALKKLALQRLTAHLFLHELHLLARLRHPSIIRFHGLTYGAKARYLVTDYCEGGTLRDLMESSFPLKLTQCLNFIVDILQGLEYAHHAGVVHCDLKPENILLVPTVSGWTARIADFGVSRLVDNSTDRGADSAQPLGSPGYKAPECYYRHYSYASDLYAVGVLLFELLIGHRPFSGQPGELMTAHLNRAMVLPKSVPFPLRSILTTALQKLPQRRFATTTAMLKSVMLAAEIIQATQPDRLAGGREPKLMAIPSIPRPTPVTQIATIDPQDRWLALVRPKINLNNCKQETETLNPPQAEFQILRLPGLVPIHASDWPQPEQLIALDQRHGLAILPDRNAQENLPDYRIWRLFNRRGDFIDYCRLPATTGTMACSTSRIYCLLTLDAADPTIAVLVDLKPLRFKRIALDFQPHFLVAVSRGYLLADPAGHMVLLDHEGVLLNQCELSQGKLFETEDCFLKSINALANDDLVFSIGSAQKHRLASSDLVWQTRTPQIMPLDDCF